MMQEHWVMTLKKVFYPLLAIIGIPCEYDGQKQKSEMGQAKGGLRIISSQHGLLGWTRVMDSNRG